MRRKNFILVLIILFSVLLFSACGIPKDALTMKNDKVEAGFNVDLTKIVKAKSDKYTYEVKEGTNVDTMKPGEYEITYVVKKGKKEAEQTFKIFIVDTTAPVIEPDQVVTVYVNGDVNLSEIVKIKENSSDPVEIIPIGDINATKKGKFKVKIKATDSSGNEAQGEITINVVQDDNLDNAFFNKIEGYWVNEQSKILIYFKKNQGSRNAIIISSLNSGPSGGDMYGEVLNIITKSATQVEIVYQDMDVNKQKTITINMPSTSTMDITATDTNLNKTYTSWSETKLNQYWKSIGQ